MKKLPYYKQQTPFTCSLACLRMVLEFFGRKFTEAELARIIGFSPRRGFSMPMMAEVCEIINFDSEIKPLADLDDIKRYISKGLYPIVIVDVETYHKTAGLEYGHFIIVKDITNENVIIDDPDIEFGSENKQVDLKLFLEAWGKSNRLIFVIRDEGK